MWNLGRRSPEAELGRGGCWGELERPGGKPAAPPDLATVEEKGIRCLLEEARRHGEEYQRLKAEAGKSDAPE